MHEAFMIQAQIWNVARTEKGTAVLIRPNESDRAVPIFIGPLEAHAILIGMSDVHMPRPLTHDLIMNLTEKLHMQIERVEITELKEGTFYAQLVVRHGMKKICLDSRPSDALGLATRAKCPIFISQSIVDSASIPINFIEESGEETINLESGFMDHPGFVHEEPNELPEENGTETVEGKFVLETPQDIQKSVLKMKLDQAIQEENYEEAARLRDIIEGLSKI